MVRGPRWKITVKGAGRGSCSGALTGRRSHRPPCRWRRCGQHCDDCRARSPPVEQASSGLEQLTVPRASPSSCPHASRRAAATHSSRPSIGTCQVANVCPKPVGRATTSPSTPRSPCSACRVLDPARRTRGPIAQPTWWRGLRAPPAAAIPPAVRSPSHVADLSLPCRGRSPSCRIPARATRATRLYATSSWDSGLGGRHSPGWVSARRSGASSHSPRPRT
jgi:hypothetical protein